MRDTLVERADVAALLLPRRSVPDRTAATGDVRPLSDYALASRLSYFLWSSMPDDELLAHAAAGDLHKPDVLAAQARRMLQDDRVRRPGDRVRRQLARLPPLRGAQRRRSRAVPELHQRAAPGDVRGADPLLRGRRSSDDRSVLDFLYGNHTFVNPVLARHYGMPEPTAAGRVGPRRRRARSTGAAGCCRWRCS